jgi:hypothetical protein
LGELARVAGDERAAMHERLADRIARVEHEARSLGAGGEPERGVVAVGAARRVDRDRSDAISSPRAASTTLRRQARVRARRCRCARQGGHRRASSVTQLDAEDIARKGVRAAAVAVEADLLKRSARTQQAIALGGGALATALAWLIRLLFAGAKSGLAEALAIACGVLGPAAVVYALATFVWPEPAAVSSGSQLGSGTLDEAIRHRLWLVRVGACAIGVVHMVVIWSLT